MTKCKHCHIPLHLCKVDDHISEVCRRAPVKCPNKVNGCPITLIREKISTHLPVCAASVVVCSRDRCRKLNVKECKLQLKHMGRRQEYLPVREDDELDVQLACFDQNLIVDSYHASRAKRVRQRDDLHPAHPLIPLRAMPYDSSKPTEGLDDSSEDELREKREKLKKSRMVFANCYMCQVDPSVQHLHTLGNGTDIEKLKKRRRTPQVLDEFHRKLNLKVSIAVENVPESTLKSENIREIKKGGTLFTLKCLKTVRRVEFGDHALSQHTQSIDQMNEMVSRFQTDTSTLTHQPSSVEFTERGVNQGSTELNIENLPLWVYESLAKYLPSSSLYNLSLVNKKIRQIVFIGCNPRCFVEPVWKTTKPGEWKQDSFIWKVSTSEAPPALVWNVPVELSQHISKCSYFDPVLYVEKMIPVFPRNLEKDIWNGFTNELSERLIRAEILEVQDRVEQAELEEEVFDF
ncbi:hypothetical protein CAEBREN_03857 [Caenorhabditis brenneri]|uniref:F-box domain-containing protein n=1 Tax=Caenorhabditis brenneri TaxID=135651 RepID=G0MHG0_CAEBE|nr:hypothetical protein CAEBREN_03857 [Caenorhabditis brenneri]